MVCEAAGRGGGEGGGISGVSAGGYYRSGTISSRGNEKI